MKDVKKDEVSNRTLNFPFNDEEDTHVKLINYDDTIKPQTVCMEKNITYPAGEIPNRGKHRPIGGKLGEYGYIPPSRYISNLIGGAVVFSYHPALPDGVVEQLRVVAHRSTNKYIITSSRYLNETFPIAILLYRQVYLMTSMRNNT